MSTHAHAHPNTDSLFTFHIINLLNELQIIIIYTVELCQRFPKYKATQVSPGSSYHHYRKSILYWKTLSHKTWIQYIEASASNHLYAHNWTFPKRKWKILYAFWPVAMRTDYTPIEINIFSLNGEWFSLLCYFKRTTFHHFAPNSRLLFLFLSDCLNCMINSKLSGDKNKVLMNKSQFAKHQLSEADFE